jgi:leader peptidase (prepilin peptidase)/N-methyltransferase
MPWNAVECRGTTRDDAEYRVMTCDGVLIDTRGFGIPCGRTALAGAAALTGTYLLVHLVEPAAMGAGDVKLATGLGGLAGCFGPDVWFLAAVTAPLLTALAGAVAWRRGARTVPHGPSMCLATAGAAGLAWLG